MVICKHCNKVIEIGQPFISLGFIGDFCDANCIKEFINSEIQKVGESYIKKNCEHCFNACENSESSMFGRDIVCKCTIDKEIDCEDVENCIKFIYGEPKKYEFIHNRNGGKEVITEAIKYVKDLD